MAWSFNVSSVTIMVLCILLLFFMMKPRLPIRLNFFFVAFALTEILTLFTDILSSWMDMHHELFPVWSLYLSNGFYFLFFIGRSFCFLAYTMALFGPSSGKVGKALQRLVCLIFLGLELIVVSCPLTGLIFSIDRDLGYRSGPFYNLIYFALYFFLLLGILYAIREAKILNPLQRYGLFLSCLAVAAGGVFRILLPHILVMNSFFMLAVLSLYLAFENADLYMEQRTSAFNYQTFEKVVEERIYLKKDFWMCSVMVRNFSEAREIYGGEQMDAAIGLVSEFLRRSFRDMTVFYDINGCFVLLGPPGTDSRSVREIVQARFKEPWRAVNTDVHVDLVYAEMASSLRFRDARDVVECVRRLMEAAAQSPDTDFILMDQEMMDSIRHSFRVRRALNRALEEGTLLAYFQPIIDARSGEVVGAEALARIQDPEIGMIPPGEFIPLAEKNGSISRLGELMFRRVCAFLHKYDLEAYGLEFINVNLSPIQCKDQNLAELFRSIMKEYDVSPEKIHLEITEEALIEEAVLHAQMDRLIEAGFSFALDDFGSGYANQFRLKEYPFTGIKLDMKIVWSHFKRPDSLLPNTVETFSNLGFYTTAEGVENQEMSEGLRDMGIVYLQGFYYAKPFPEEAFVAYIENQRAERQVEEERVD